MMDEVLAGHGIISCVEEAPPERAEHLEIGPSAQAWQEDSSAGEITGTNWTPNRLSFSVTLTRRRF